MLKKSHRSESGSILIEGLIALALLLIIVSAMVPMFTLSSKTTANNKIQTIAYNAASEELEKIKAMDYDDIGTVGGYPEGTITRDTNRTIEGIDFSITADVKWQDDPDDGLTADEEDPDGRDYKLVTVTIAWEGVFGPKSLRLNTKIARQSEDQAFIGGNVKVIVQDSLGNPIEDVCITMPICPSTSSEIKGYTDELGEFIFYALNPSTTTDDCTMTASKSGYLVQPGLEQQATTVLLCKTSTVMFVMERPGTLSVKLVDQDENPITTSSTITVASASTSDTVYADPTGGSYTLNNLYPGIWTVLPVAEGYEATTTASAAQVNPAQLTVLTIKLQELTPLPREFYVYDYDTGLPIDDAQVSLTNLGTGVNTVGTSDSSGTCDMNLINGTYSLSVSKADYYADDSEIVFDDYTSGYSIPLYKAYLATFTVKDIGGDPIEYAEIVLTKGSSVTTKSTESDGSCEVYLVTGTYTLAISKTGYDPYTDSKTISISGNDFDITLSETTYPSNFTVIDSYGDPIGNAEVKLTKGVTVTTGHTNINNPDKGLFSVNLVAGNYTLEVSKSDFTPSGSSPIEIVSIGGNDFTTTLNAITYASNFTVEDSGGNPISGATVHLTNTVNGSEVTDTTNGSGVRTFNLAVGNYTLDVSKSGYVPDISTPSTISIASGGSNYTITLNSAPTTGNIRVRITWFGNPYTNKDIRIRQGSDVTGPKTPDSNGYVYFNDLEAGSYTVEREKIIGSGWTDNSLEWGSSPTHYSNPVTVTTGNTTECRFELP
jgi:hypothetical protein